MENSSRFLQRINYKGSLSELMSQICVDYEIGDYQSHKIVSIGYEDLNLVVTTERGQHFAKLFSSARKPEECQRYVSIMEQVLAAGISHPKLYDSPQGHLYKIKTQEADIRLCVMEFIEGQSFYETGQKPTDEEGIFLVEQAAKINGINYHPTFVYDGWAISNFLTEYERNEQNLEKEDRLAIEGFVKNFRELDINSLPHSLVHGDLISTNVMKDRNNRLYIIDFSVANSYPRIQELAVLLCDLFFDPSSPEAFLKKYNWAAGEYQKHIKLTPEELKALPIFAQAAHAMHVIGASSERVNGNTEGENSSWLELGRKGLKLSKQLI